MPKNKFVLDTNIWVSYFLNAKPDQLLNAARNNIFFTSDALIEELGHTLRKEKISRFLFAPVEEFITFHKKISIHLYPDQKHSVFDDSKDDFLIDLAVKADADYIVSGDRHVLKILIYKKVQIITLREFRQLLTLRN